MPPYTKSYILTLIHCIYSEGSEGGSSSGPPGPGDDEKSKKEKFKNSGMLLLYITMCVCVYMLKYTLAI